jgi:GT2 family glycosyltransferase
VNDSAHALIITVNFRRAEATVRFLNTASGLERFDSCHLLVLDNDSDDGSVDRIRRAIHEFGNVELLESSQNRGYFGGANWALRHYLQSHGAPEWVIVCNNDIEFDDSCFLLRLFQRDPTAAGVIAPSIVSGLTGHDANPSIRQRPSQFKMMRYRWWLSNYYAMWLKQWLSPYVRRGRYTFSRRVPRAGEGLSSRIYAPHGAFLVFSRKFFEAGGFIDDGFFLYAEEFSVAEMCRQLRLPVIHDPELRVWHSEGQSTGRMLSRSVHRHQKSGFAYALSRYHNSYPEIEATAPAVRKPVPNAPSSSVATAGDSIR